MDLPEYDPAVAPGELLELVIVGGGPAGLAVAGRVAAAGYKVVVVDPAPLGR
jgi:lycopene beta-cyclase